MYDYPDAVLLEKAKQGAQGELGELLKRHGPPLRKRLDINNKWRSILEPDDIMQVTYLDAVMDIQQFRGNHEQFADWLWSISRNNLLDAISELERYKRPQPDKRIQSTNKANSLVDLYMELTAGTTTPSGKFAKTEIIDILNNEIAALPEDYGKVLHLRYFQELGFEDIATEMGRSYGAAVLLHHRARTRLAERLGSPSQFFSK